MTPPHRNRRLITLAAAALLVAAAAALALSALRENISYFKTPSDLAAEPVEAGARVRLGGVVEEGSVRYEDGAQMRFSVTDGANTVDVIYSGLVPDLFLEGQGVIADGRIDPQTGLIADQVLAKHDEDYEPIELKGVKSATEG